MEPEKFQIFVSSPFRGFADQRKAIVQAIINWGHIPIALENFSPQVQRDFEVIRKAIEDCQIYILILGHRYGTIIEDPDVPKDARISYTQFEFEEAIEKRLAPLVFLKDYEQACEEIKQDDEILDKKVEMDRLKKFHDLIKEKKIYLRPWTKNINLEEVCGRAIKQTIEERRVLLPGWIRAGEGENTKKVQMALKNIFVSDMIGNINSFAKLDERCSIRVEEKQILAKLFRETFLNTIIDHKFSLFFESDSCPAFIAKELGSAPVFKAALARKDADTPNLYTNNILAFMELWMNDHLPVSMLPKSSPKEQYGATYGVLDELIDADRSPDYGRAALDKHTKDAIERLRGSADAIPMKENMLLICSISGVQVSDKHNLALQNKDDELQQLVDQCYGFHAGSYKNIVFKRYLYSTKFPVIMTLTSSEIDFEISQDRCHFIFDREYIWEDFYKTHPLAFCIGCRNDERQDVSTKFAKLGLDVKYKIYNDFTAVLATNEAFRQKVPFDL